MKLKVKLAKEFAETETYIDSRFTAENAFISGFEKAREMAAKIAYGPDFDGTGDAIDELGEEEVECNLSSRS